eukprot:8572238-Pyramimonas_sp.AAC.1
MHCRHHRTTANSLATTLFRLRCITRSPTFHHHYFVGAASTKSVILPRVAGDHRGLSPLYHVRSRCFRRWLIPRVAQGMRITSLRDVRSRVGQ